MGNFLFVILVIIALVKPNLSSGKLKGKIIVDRELSDLSSFIVWIEKGKNLPSPKIKSKNKLKSMNQKNKTFYPKILAINIFDTVSFKNLDPIFHNVFSLHPKNKFDLGNFKGGNKFSDDLKNILKGDKQYYHKFKNPGKVPIYCNIHPDMYGIIYIFDHHYFSSTNFLGEFELPSLPKGNWVLMTDSPHFQRPHKKIINV